MSQGRSWNRGKDKTSIVADNKGKKERDRRRNYNVLIRLLDKEKSQQKVLFAFTRRVQKGNNIGKWRGICKRGTIPQITAVFNFFSFPRLGPALQYFLFSFVNCRGIREAFPDR